MKLIRSLVWFALALASAPTLALADEPVDWALRRVENGLVKPLNERQSNRFSRARPVPSERRARIPSGHVMVDKESRAFVRFAVDVRHSANEWHENYVGCVYRKSGNLYVKVGDAYRPAAFLLGKDVQPVAGACEGVPARA